MPTPPLNRLLVLSNGHGEDLIAQRILQALRSRRPDVEIRVLPLVGLGEVFAAAEAAGQLQRIGPQLRLPSGGFSNQSLRGLVRDLAAGLPPAELAPMAAGAAVGAPGRSAAGRRRPTAPAAGLERRRPFRLHRHAQK